MHIYVMSILYYCVIVCMNLIEKTLTFSQVLLIARALNRCYMC